MAFIQYLKFDNTALPLPDSYDLDLTDVEADSGGETEAGRTQRDVVRTGVVTIGVSFSVHPCIACEKCHNGIDGCTFKDDMEELNPHLIAADAIVFVSPIYYYDINAQIKTVIDRFYANDAAMHGNKKTALLVALADDQRNSADGAVSSFENMAEYLEWQVARTIIAAGCGDSDALKNTNYPKDAYEMGKSL